MRRFTGILLVVLLGVLVATNPGMEAFSTFAADQSERILREETGDSPLGRALAGAGAGLAGSYVERVTERRSYLLFSTYTINLADTADETHAWRFLGIAGRFVELDNPEEKR